MYMCTHKVRKAEDHALPSLSLSPGLGMVLWLGGREEVSLVHCKFSHSGRVTGKLLITDELLHVQCTGSAYISGHVVNGRIARAAS